jgi:glutathione S-transferase
MPLAILYSYRRCPYAMRARMALSYAQIPLEIREVSLKQKPAHLLQVSPKGTVPVLVLPDASVIDQSLDIMQWALRISDIDGWLSANAQHTMQLIADNDGAFKQSLDRYKYAIRFPEHPAAFYRSQGEVFLRRLETQLSQNKYLLADTATLADIAIFPFIRQFAAVDAAWFETCHYNQLRVWLQRLVTSDLFANVMVKHPAKSVIDRLHGASNTI